MEWFGYALIFGLVFIFLISVFSDRRDRRGRYRGRRSDFWDDYDDYDDYDYPPYWPPPYHRYRRRTSFGSLLIAFFMGILVFAAVVGGVIRTVRNETRPLPEIHPSSPAKANHPSDYDHVPEVNVPPPSKPPTRKFVRQPHDRLMKLTNTDPVSLRQIQQTYPSRGIEGYRDNTTGQIWAVVFGSSETLNDLGFILDERKEDLIERGLVFTKTVYRTGQVCANGDIVKEEGTDIWFCNEVN